jgi:predicted SprT family Zn-dependent metalloprotease
VSATAYEEIASHEGLIDWSRAYCKHVRRERAVDVRFDTVEWVASTRAKRRAAAVKRPQIPGASVGDPVDWERVETAGGRWADGRPLDCTVSLSWTAFESYDRPEWEAILRHELIHVEQFQQYGTTGHGSAFRALGVELDTDVHCRTFTTPKSVFRCAACDSVIARRYQECKLARRHEEYRSSCCQRPLECESPTDA